MHLSYPFNRVFRILCVASIVLIAACSNDDNTVEISDPTTTPPTIPDVTAPADLTGIWEGTVTQATNIYDVTMVFSKPIGVSEGRVMGIATKQGTEEPYILIDAGYQDVTNDNLGYDYLVGKDGSQGTFMKFFDFDNNLVGAKRGTITLDMSGNTLTGTTTLEDLGGFVTVLNYSLQNAKESTLADLVGAWSDSDYGWDDTATGMTLIVNLDGTISALATGGSTCEGSGLVSDIENYNIYIFDGTSINTGVSLTNCGTRITNVGTPQQTTEFVDGNYDGMGFLIEDEAGNNTLVIVMSSTLLKIPSMATYNEFIKN